MATRPGSTITLNESTFTANDWPLQIDPAYINSVNNTNDYKGNTNDFVIVYNYTNPIKTVSTWHKVNVGYQVPATEVTRVNIQSLLTIEPGVVIEFGEGTSLQVHEDGGGLKAVGTAAAPIVFTGISKVKKAWTGIYVNSTHPENEIAFAEFHYSGLPTSNPPKLGTVRVWYDKVLNIHDVVFKEHTDCGIHYGGSGTNVTIGSNITVDEGGCISTSF